MFISGLMAAYIILYAVFSFVSGHFALRRPAGIRVSNFYTINELLFTAWYLQSADT